MAYTTITNVRSESGFTGNTNITDAMLTIYLNQTNWIVQSYISSVYDITDLTWANFTLSQAEYMLKRIEELMASWYLLIKEYWREWLDADKNGYEKVNEWMELLKMITSWELRLIWVDWSEFDRINKSTAWSMVAWWAVSGDNIFWVNDEY